MGKELVDIIYMCMSILKSFVGIINWVLDACGLETINAEWLNKVD